MLMDGSTLSGAIGAMINGCQDLTCLIIYKDLLVVKRWSWYQWIVHGWIYIIMGL
jgi:hypothetical protein